VAKEWTNTPIQLRILTMMKKHLDREFKARNIILSGGIHIKPKPKKARLDLIELNCLGPYFNESRITKKTIAFVNINYQDEDYDKVLEMTLFVNNLLTDAIVGKFHLTHSNQEWEYEIFRISPYLWLGNNAFRLTHI